MGERKEKYHSVEHIHEAEEVAPPILIVEKEVYNAMAHNDDDGASSMKRWALHASAGETQKPRREREIAKRRRGKDVKERTES